MYLDLLSHNARLHRLAISGYCLMPNHVHVIATPELPESLPLALKTTHGRYAAYLNGCRASSGHVWQGRYYSCPLDERHFWMAMRYVDCNPVRAGLVEAACGYRWSSAAAHCENPPPGWTGSEWQSFLAEACAAEGDDIRRATHAGRPIGSPEFVRKLEVTLGRILTPQRRGRHRKAASDFGQASLLENVPSVPE